MAPPPDARPPNATSCHHSADKDGRVTGAEAKTLFPRSRLSQQSLAVVWSLCDEDKTGFIDLENFDKAMELITMAQAGRPVSNEQWLLQLKVLS